MNRLNQKKKFGAIDLEVPPIIFGTSCLGNLYQEIPYEAKRYCMTPADRIE